MGEHHWGKKKRALPLFLSSTLLGGRLRRWRRGGLGDTSRLGLADDLGLLNNGGGLGKIVSD